MHKPAWIQMKIGPRLGGSGAQAPFEGLTIG